ncbi:MAG: helix-turn-helix domain-containing protein [Candidatus Nanopelagicales bacterium]
MTYSLEEAAQRIGGVSARWLAERLRKGEFPGHKFDRVWRMTEADIQVVMERFRVQIHSDGAPESTGPPKRAAAARKPKKTHSVESQQVSLFD